MQAARSAARIPSTTRWWKGKPSFGGHHVRDVLVQDRLRLDELLGGGGQPNAKALDSVALPSACNSTTYPDRYAAPHELQGLFEDGQLIEGHPLRDEVDRLDLLGAPLLEGDQ